MKMRYFLWIAVILGWSASAWGQLSTKTTICASGCTYTNTFAGLSQAVSDAVSSQSANCAPYIIEITAGTSIDAGANTLTLPAKTCKQYVTIRSSGVNQLTDGTRLIPANQSAALATLIGSSATGQTALVMTALAAYTAYWRFEGLEFNISGGNNNVPYSIALFLGETVSNFPAAVDPAQRPDHIEIKHCWIHGVSGARNLLNGVAVGGDSIRILDSYFEAIAGDGTEAHSVLINYSDGPVEVRNNRLSSSTETVLIGGSLQPAGLLPTFLRFIGNDITKDPAYKFGTGTVNPTWACRQGYVYRNTSTNHDWICNNASTWIDQGGLTSFGPDVLKNHFECKVCRGVRMYGNEFTTSWMPAAQDPSWITLNLTTQGALNPPGWIQPFNQPQPWTTIGDVAVFGNVGHDGLAAMMILGFPGIDCGGSCAAGTSGQVCAVSTAGICYPLGHNRIRFHDNLFYNISDARDYDAGSSDGEPIGYSLNSGASDIYIYHNTTVLSTFPGSGSYTRIGLGPGDSTMFGEIVFRDNITPTGTGGLRTNNTTQFPAVYYGECTLVAGTGPNGGEDARDNVFTLDGGSAWAGVTPVFGSLGSCPGGSTTWKSGQDAANGAAVVNETTPTYMDLAAYQGTASDGRNPGADINLVNWLEAGADSGAFNSGLDFLLLGAIANTPTGEIVYFTSYDTSACTVIASTDANQYSNPITATVVQTGRGGIATWAPGALTPTTLYWVRATCDGFQQEWTVNGARFSFMTEP